MWDRLNPLDAAFLEAEDEDRHVSMAISSVAILEGPAPPQEEFMAALTARLPLVNRYRQKIKQVPFDLGRPIWVDDPSFDLAHHVRRTALPAPGDDAALFRLIGRVMSQRLDRDRPLWEYWVIEGLAEDRWALISKVHHCMVDGVSGTHLYYVLFDAAADSDRVLPVDTWSPAKAPSNVMMTTEALLALALNPVEQVRLVAAAMSDPRAALAKTLETIRGLRALAGTFEPITPTSLVGPIGQQRRYAAGRVPLADVTAIREKIGASLNDVVLAAITGGFRDLLTQRGEEPAEGAVRSLVPVSVRVPGEEGIYENRVSLMLATLPVHLADPGERLRAVHGHLTELKASMEAQAAETLTRLSKFEPFPALSWAFRMAAHIPQRTIATVTTNVPGPRVPLYLLGRRLVEILPYVPIASQLRIGVSIFTYCDQVTFGITGDYKSAPEVKALAAAIVHGVNERRSVRSGIRSVRTSVRTGVRTGRVWSAE